MVKLAPVKISRSTASGHKLIATGIRMEFLPTHSIAQPTRCSQEEVGVSRRAGYQLLGGEAG